MSPRSFKISCPGVTFHFVNVVVDWDAVVRETFELEVDLLLSGTGWLNRHSTLALTVERTAAAVGPSVASGEKVIDFRKQRIPDFLS